MQQTTINPDSLERCYIRCRGEFSLNAINSFSRHLDKIKIAMDQIEPEYKSGKITRYKMRVVHLRVFKEAKLWY